MVGPLGKGGVLSPRGSWALWGRLVEWSERLPAFWNREAPPAVWLQALGGDGWPRWPERCVSSPKCDMQKLTVDELKRLLYDTFCEHLSMKDIENIIMTEEESHLGTAECPVDVESE